MKSQQFSDGDGVSARDLWIYARRGKITGSKLKDVYSARGIRKIGFWELVAERLGLPPDDGETALERGQRLEGDAIDRFAAETGKTVDKGLILWTRDDNESIALSPDGVISETEAVEAKCLSSARHIEAYVTREIPDEYRPQAVQYFIVNDKLETLHFVFYDPRFALFRDPETQKQNALDYFVIDITRAEVAAEVELYLAFQYKALQDVNEIVNRLTF